MNIQAAGTTDPQIFMVGFPSTSTSTPLEYLAYYKVWHDSQIVLPTQQELTYRELYDEPGDLP